MSTAIPEVTIALPVYNGSEWIEQALTSLHLQDYKNHKIVVSDDCSSDNTYEICKRISKNLANVRVSKNDQNLGSLQNLLKILNECDSKYFLWASQDDYWDRSFLRKLINKLESNDNLVLACSNTELVYLNGAKKTIRYSQNFDLEKLSSSSLASAILLPINGCRWLKTNLLIHGVIKTDVIKYAYNAFKVHNKLIPSQDRNQLFFIAIQGRCGYVDETLYHRRVGTGSITRLKNHSLPKNNTKSLKFDTFFDIYKNCYLMIAALIGFQNATLRSKLAALIMILKYSYFKTKSALPSFRRSSKIFL